MEEPAVPWRLVTRHEVVAGRRWQLQALEDFESASAELYRQLDGAWTAQERVDLSPMFGVIWGSTRAIAERLDALDLTGTTLLELGCGLALSSLVAARAGARVLATDQHPSTGTFLARNAALNSVEVPYAHLDLRTDHTLGRFDRVVASDVLFAHDMPAIVASAFRRHLAPGGIGWLADPGRSWLDEFLDAASAEGLSPETTIDRVDVPGSPDGPEDIFVVTLRP